MKILNRIWRKKKILIYLFGSIIIYIVYCSFTKNNRNYNISIDNCTDGKLNIIVYFDEKVIFDDMLPEGTAPKYLNINSKYGLHKIEIKRKDNKKLTNIETFFSLPIWYNSPSTILRKNIFLTHFSEEVRVFVYDEGISIENAYYKRTFI